jgi:glycerol-3-phosphate dehydrogenase
MRHEHQGPLADIATDVDKIARVRSNQAGEPLLAAFIWPMTAAEMRADNHFTLIFELDRQARGKTRSAERFLQTVYRAAHECVLTFSRATSIGARIFQVPGVNDFGAGLTEREVAWQMREEWARAPADILWRRSKLGLRIDAAGQAALAAFMGAVPARRAAE